VYECVSFRANVTVK